MGGKSSEREVSLVSGKNVAEALASLGKYEVVSVDLTDDSLAPMPHDIDAVYIALHGGWGESGGVQAALDALGIPYTGPGAEASRLAMDKVLTKRALDAAQVPTARWTTVTADLPVERLSMPLPVVVKPPCDGSSVGISKVSSPDDWPRALAAAKAAQRGSETPLLVEEYIPGREFTVAVLDGEAWPVIEIVAPGGWYGYNEKYNSEATRYPFLEDDDALAARLQATAVAAYRAIGCRGVTRIDFRVSTAGEAYVLELNTSPGFTSHSLVPKAGCRMGLSFADVCERILARATCDYRECGR